MDNPITATRADAIRDRFLSRAAAMRQDAIALRAQGDDVNADALIRLAESQERMAAKRYESMTIVGAL